MIRARRLCAYLFAFILSYGTAAALDFRPAVLRLPLLAHLSGAESAAPLHLLHKD